MNILILIATIVNLAFTLYTNSYSSRLKISRKLVEQLKREGEHR